MSAENPRIRVIDFESSDMEPPEAKVIEFGWCDVTRADDGSWTVGAPHSALCGAEKIAPGARSAHHISPAEIAGLPAFHPALVWGGLTNDGADLVAAHNAEFEGKFWGEPARPVLCTYKAALRVWPEAPSHSNGALRYWLEDQGIIAPEHALTQPAHRAGPDAYVTAHLLVALLAHASAQQMVAWTKEPRLLPTCPIGKEWRGKPWRDVDTGFLQWMTRQADMEADLRWNADRELTRRLESA